MLAITGHSSLSKTDVHRHPASESVSPLPDCVRHNIKNESAIDIDKKIQTVFELNLLEEFLTTPGAALLPFSEQGSLFLINKHNVCNNLKMTIAE